MELRIEKLTLPEVINFNFSELKQEITNVTANYANLVYDEGQMREAKKDVAALRKFTKALSDERIRVKKELLKPYDAFEGKVKELCCIVDSAIDNIDSQIKGAEEKRKAEKLEKIKAAFEHLNKPDWLKFEQVMDQRWLNASVSINKVSEDMAQMVDAIEEHLATLANLPEYGFECVEVYKTTLNLTSALNEGRRLSEMAKRAEAARLAKEEAKTAPKSAIGQTIASIERQAFENFTNPPEPEEKKPEMEWIAFRALMTTEEAKKLRAFFEMHDIRFEPIRG